MTTPAGLDTVSLRLRLTVLVLLVLGLVLAALGVAVDRIYTAQSERNLDSLLTGRVQLARQLARTGVGPQPLVRRVDADGVRAHLVLRSGAEFGTPVETRAQVTVRRATLTAPGRLNRSVLTLAVDTSLVDGAHTTLRRALVVAALAATVLGAVLAAVVVRLALRPLTTMASLAREIADGRRGRRLSPTRTHTELGRTASAFDDMLDELEGAEARARAADARSREFLSDAAHELRTPIAGVQAAAETLLHQRDQLGEEQREQLEVLLIREAQRAGRLVSDLLQAARLEAGLELDPAPTSLRDLIGTEVERATVLHPDVGFHVTGTDVVVPVDGARISAVLRNLLDNAVRAGGPGGTVAVTLAGDPDRVTVDVSDSGPGVPVADRERIFERLVRLDQSRHQDSGGSGLGLAIARGFARAHGGDLTCEPAPAGARFRLTLPRQPDVARPDGG